MATPESHLSPDFVASQAAKTIALQMLEERGRGAVLVGVARVDAALEHLLPEPACPAAWWLIQLEEEPQELEPPLRWSV